MLLRATFVLLHELFVIVARSTLPALKSGAAFSSFIRRRTGNGFYDAPLVALILSPVTYEPSQIKNRLKTNFGLGTNTNTIVDSRAKEVYTHGSRMGRDYELRRLSSGLLGLDVDTQRTAAINFYCPVFDSTVTVCAHKSPNEKENM